MVEHAWMSCQWARPGSLNIIVFVKDDQPYLQVWVYDSRSIQIPIHVYFILYNIHSRSLHINFIITKHTCSTEVKVRNSLTTHWYWLVLIIIISDTPILVHTYFQMLLIICPCLLHIVIIELSSMYCRVHIIYVMKSWIDKTSDKILTSDWFWSEDDLSLTVSLVCDWDLSLCPGVCVR